ncbi:MAG: DUF6328 family protein [Limisphaerales bacterium]
MDEQSKQPDHLPQKQFSQSLSGELNTVEQEARMVLPGIQALFGFQLIAVFNQGFKMNLDETEQVIHLIALLLVSISAILVIAPAAYHRQANHQVSKHFLQLSSRFLAWAMAPLALGSCLDIYLVSRIIVSSVPIALGVTLLIFLIYLWAWFILPRLHRRRIEDLPVVQLPR